MNSSIHDLDSDDFDSFIAEQPTNVGILCVLRYNSPSRVPKLSLAPLRAWINTTGKGYPAEHDKNEF